MNMWNDLKQMAWSQISLNIVTLHYESTRAQSVLSCQTFFTDENTLFMVKGSMENQFELQLVSYYEKEIFLEIERISQHR